MSSVGEPEPIIYRTEVLAELRELEAKGRAELEARRKAQEAAGS